jgi:hypothetical protein
VEIDLLEGTWCGSDVLCFKFGLKLVIPYSRNRTSDIDDCIAGLLNRLYMITVLIWVEGLKLVWDYMILVYIERYFKTPPHGHTCNPGIKTAVCMRRPWKGRRRRRDNCWLQCSLRGLDAWTTLKTLKHAEITMPEKHISDASRRSSVTQKRRVTYVASLMWTQQWRVKTRH